MGFRTPFITNSAAVACVNASLFVTGIHAHGMANKFNGHHVKITSADTSPMIPTGIEEIDPNDASSWYGVNELGNNNQNPLNDSQIPTSFGNIKPFKRYYGGTYNLDKGELPELMQSIHLFHVENNMLNPPISWEYRPQVSVLNPQVPIAPYRSKTDIIDFGCKTSEFKNYKVNFDDPVNYTFFVESESNRLPSFPDAELSYNSYVEQVGWMANGFTEYGGGMVPPSLHVGCLPVHAYRNEKSTATDVQTVQIIWKCDTMVEIEYSYDYATPFGGFGNAHNLHMMDRTWGEVDKSDRPGYGYWMSGYNGSSRLSKTERKKTFGAATPSTSSAAPTI